jgi:outer membrane protein
MLSMKREIGIKRLVMLLYLLVSLPLITQAETLTNMTLQQCIETALQNHQSLKVSNAVLNMAEAQYQQAMSAYWPRVHVDVNAQRADEDRTFSFEGNIQLPQQLTQGLSLALNQPISPTVPVNTEIKLYDRDLLTSSVNLTYPIFTGGKRGAIREQAEKGVGIAEHGRRKTELEVIRDVKKYFYGAQFANQMEQLADVTLERFKVLNELTSRLYQNGSLKVKKTDYLRTQTTTEITRSMLEEARYARSIAHEALANAMGLHWQDKISLATDDLIETVPDDLAGLIAAAQQFNPDIQQLRLAVDGADSKITEARSGYFPVIGFQASAYSVQNDYKKGLTNSANRDGWTLGLGLKWNLFDGFETPAKVSYANALKRKITGQQILLDQGMALQIKQQFLRLGSASRQIESTKAAARYAAENRRLHQRAYQQEIMETKDVIEAQIVETFTQSAVHRTQHSLALALSSLEYLVGSNIRELH